MSVKKGLVTCLAIAAVCATFQQTVNADEVSGKQYTSSTVNQLVSGVKSVSDETGLSGFISSPLVVGATSVSGNAVANAKVDVLINGSVKATVRADAAGNWTAQVSALSKEQIVQLRSTLDDWSAYSDRYQVVDNAPTVLSPVVIGETKVAGVAAPKSKVDVWVGGAIKATVYADEGGIWVAKVPALEAGQIVQPRASMGSWYADSDRYEVVDKTPTVLSPLVTGKTKVAGVAAPGSKVDVWVGGSVKATVYADAGGIWTAQVPELVKGQVVQPKSSIGVWKEDGDRYQVTDEAPTVITPVVVGETKVAGVAAPGAKVDVWVGGAIKATVYADEGGIWVAKVPALEKGQIVQPRASISNWYADSARYQVNDKNPTVTSTIAAGVSKLSGVAAPNSKVDVWVSGAIKATAYADVSGNWNTEVTKLEKNQIVQVRASVGNWYADSERYQAFDGTPSLLTDLVAGATKIAGVTLPGAEVDVWIDGRIKANVFADENGIWVAKVPALVQGQVVKTSVSLGNWFAEGGSNTVAE
ncbi:hypothetical protein [Listeria booriae]|uniref:hypothetical protein n=1 Tax=Listeria booriae TaxID=1552123 RepID=UPI00162624E1|nr:hypothetical protein [Listeria booriae]MBC1358196.1 hypothetical protein [Listeria booriae]